MTVVEPGVFPQPRPPQYRGEHATQLFNEYRKDRSDNEESDQCHERKKHQWVISKLEAHTISEAKDLSAVGWDE